MPIQKEKRPGKIFTGFFPFIGLKPANNVRRTSVCRLRAAEINPPGGLFYIIPRLRELLPGRRQRLRRSLFATDYAAAGRNEKTAYDNCRAPASRN